MQVNILCIAGSTLEDRVIAAIEAAQTLPETPLPLATHVALAFVRDDGESFGVEAVPPAVHLFSPRKYAAATCRTYRLALAPMQARTMWTTAHMAVGRPYGWTNLLAAASYVLEGRPTHWVLDPDAQLDCSALVATCLAAAGLVVQEGVPPDAITPAAVEAFAVAHVAHAA